jgi:hypothetical protein
MFETFVLGTLALAGLVVIAILVGVVALVCWLFVLPFKLLGLLLKGLAVILVLPLVLVPIVILAGAGLLVFMLPALPLLLFVAVVWWLVRRRHRRPAAA